MLIFIALLATLGVLSLLCIIGYFVYFYFYPERSRSGLLNIENIVDAANDGEDGEDGKDGTYGEFALNGFDGLPGLTGDHGKQGRHSFITGLNGGQGPKGFQGPTGTGGSAGNPGIPSNGLVPLTFRDNEDSNIYKPISFEDNIVYGGEERKLSVSFLFDEVNDFSLLNGENGNRFKIDTSDGSKYLTITNTLSANIVGRKIYTSVRVVLENDGNIFYTSTPITRDSYLLVSDVNLSSSLTNTYKLRELNIDVHKDFGLNFDKIVNTDPNTHFYNYLVGGNMKYRTIFNIDPPSFDISMRIEERFSSEPIENFEIVNITLPTKGNIIKYVSDDNNNSYILSNEFENGKVIIRDASNNKNLFIQQNIRNISDSLDLDLHPFGLALQQLESNNNSFRSGNVRGKIEKLIDNYQTAPFQNILFSMKNVNHVTPPEYGLSFGSPGDEFYNPTDTGTYPVPTGYEAFSTVLNIRDIEIEYPNESIPITYPSNLVNSTLQMKFYISFDINNIRNKNYNIWLNGSTYTTPHKVRDNDLLILNTIKQYEFDPILGSSIIYQNDKLYYLIDTALTSNIELRNIYGKRVFIRLSNAKFSFESRIGKSSNFNNTLPARISQQQITNTAFDETNSNYNFQAGTNDVDGFDFLFEIPEASIENNLVEIGYNDTSNVFHITNVNVNRTSNGDYYFDFPIEGFNN